MSIELYSWGAAEEVTGSKHFIKFDDQIIQIDCGAFQGRRKESEKRTENGRSMLKKLMHLFLPMPIMIIPDSSRLCLKMDLVEISMQHLQVVLWPV